MRSKLAVIASALLFVGVAWLWIAREAPPGLRAAEEAAGADPAQKQRPGAPQPELSSRKPAAPGSSGSRAVRENGASPSEAAESDSPRTSGAPFDRQEWPSILHALHAQDQEVLDDDEGGAELDEFSRFKKLLASLRAASRAAPGGEPIDADAAGLAAEDVERLDLDEDRAIASWELERSRRLVKRAEGHPVKNDLYDGAYPVERGDYGRPEWEFDAVDTNRDGLLDVDEYYAFLVDTEKTTLHLDTDGDRQISFDESGLSEDAFAPLDRDGSGTLKGWEIRRAITQEAFP